MKLIFLCCFIVAGFCFAVFKILEVEYRPQELSVNGMAGYLYCLNNPKEKLYTGVQIYNCEFYLIRNKQYYENTINKKD